MERELVAVATYGSQRVTDPRTKKRISAYKIGYTGGTSQVLLNVFGKHARDVSSKRATYHYIHINGNVQVRQGFLLLRLTSDQMNAVETITRGHDYSVIYVWRDEGWWMFPSLNRDSFEKATSGCPSYTGFSIRGTQPDHPTSDSQSGIIVEISQRDTDQKPWIWLSGDTYPHREMLKRWGCRWSKRRKSWYFVGEKLPDAIQQLVDEVNQASELPAISQDEEDPCSIEEAEAILGVKIAAKPSSEPESSQDNRLSEAESPIRIIKPILETPDGKSDTVIDAIQCTKSVNLPDYQSAQANNRNLYQIAQSPCGELTGSITGNVWAYGWGITDGICVYLNCAGPRMAVEAIRAKLARGEIANCVPWDAPAVELTAGEGNTGMYTAFLQNIPSAKFTSLILVHECISQPNYNGDSVTHLFYISEYQAMSQLRYHITQLVKVPVFPEWTSYLWQAGQTAMLLRSTRTGGDVQMYSVILDETAWTRLIAGGLAEKVIQLP